MCSLPTAKWIVVASRMQPFSPCRPQPHLTPWFLTRRVCPAPAHPKLTRRTDKGKTVSTMIPQITSLASYLSHDAEPVSEIACAIAQDLSDPPHQVFACTQHSPCHAPTYSAFLSLHLFFSTQTENWVPPQLTSMGRSTSGGMSGPLIFVPPISRCT